MAVYLLACDGDIVIQAGSPVCTGSWVSSPAAQPFVIDAVVIETLGQAFSAGFGIVMTVYFLSWGFRQVLSFLK